MKRKINLSLLLVALMMCTLVGCGKDKDDEKESDFQFGLTTESTTESDSQTTEGFSDTSMDGGAPAPEVKPDETTTEETTTEAVVPVEVTFTLMSEDGSAVAFEGTVPEGLTLVSGDGTNHIEFAYDENPAVTVYLDGDADNNVLVANELYLNQNMPQYIENNPLSEATATYSLAVAPRMTSSFTINGTEYYIISAGLNHLFYPADEIGCITDQDNNVDYRVYSCDCHGHGNSSGYVIDPNSNEFGYIIWKSVVLADIDSLTAVENPFTITIEINQPEIDSISNYEMLDFNDNAFDNNLAGTIVESFSN